MIRVRTFFQNGKIKFNLDSLSFDYGTPTTGTYDEYGTIAGYDSITTINNNTFYTINGSDVFTTNSATYNFVTTSSNLKVTVYLNSSCGNGDYFCVGNLDSDSITKAAAKVTNSKSTSYTYTVPTAGSHYIKIFFRNDGNTSNQRNNLGYFRADKFTNTVEVILSITKAITLKAGSDWYISSKPTWITVSATSGSKGNHTLNITSAINNTAANRSGQIVFVCNNKQFTIAVSQGVSPNTVSVNPSKLSFAPDGGTARVTVTTVGNNDKWTASKSGSFITISNTSGSSGGTIDVTVPNYSTTSSRSGTITVKGNIGGSATVNVFQESYACSCNCQDHRYEHSTCNPYCPNDTYKYVCYSDCDAECEAYVWECDCDGQSSCVGEYSCYCNSKTPCDCNEYEQGCGCDMFEECKCESQNDEGCGCDTFEQASCGCKEVCVSQEYNLECLLVMGCQPYQMECSNCPNYYLDNDGIPRAGFLYDCDCDTYTWGFCDTYCEPDASCLAVCVPITDNGGSCNFVALNACDAECEIFEPDECIETIGCTNDTPCVCVTLDDKGCGCDIYEECEYVTLNVLCDPDCPDDNCKVVYGYQHGCGCNGACPRDEGWYTSGCRCDSDNICNSDCESKSTDYCTGHCTSDSTCGCHSYVTVT